MTDFDIEDNKSSTKFDQAARGSAIQKFVSVVASAPRGAYVRRAALQILEDYQRRALCNLVTAGVFTMRALSMGQGKGVTTEYAILNDDEVLNILGADPIVVYDRWVRHPPTRKLPRKKVVAETAPVIKHTNGTRQTLAENARRLSEQFGNTFDEIAQGLGISTLLKSAGYEPNPAGEVLGIKIKEDSSSTGDVMVGGLPLDQALRVHAAVERLRNALK